MPPLVSRVQIISMLCEGSSMRSISRSELAEPGMTTDVLCAPGFSTKAVRNVPSARKRAIYKVYGMAPDAAPCPCESGPPHSLGLGGSNKPRKSAAATGVGGAMEFSGQGTGALSSKVALGRWIENP
jgi:hypothetical protein